MYNAVTAIRAHYNKKIKPVKAQRQWLNLTQPDSLIAFKYSSLSDTGGWHAAGLTVLHFPYFFPPNVCSAHMCPITQLHLTLCDSVDYSLPGSSDHGIFFIKNIWGGCHSSSKESSWPRDQTHIFCIGRWILYHWATREAPSLQKLRACMISRISSPSLYYLGLSICIRFNGVTQNMLMS